MDKIAFVFPGQGSQYVGMLSNWINNKIVQETYSQASQVLGYDLWQLSQNDEIELNKTDKTQPAILVASVALYRVLIEQVDIQIDYVAGHSLGEYTALVISGAIEFIDAVKLVERRGLLMQQAVPIGVGAMAAILGLDDNTVVDACKEAAKDEIVSAANFNSHGQIVISGSVAAVERAIELCKNLGAKKTILLPVSVPSHCMLMQEAANNFAGYLQEIQWHQPTIPIIQNTTAEITSDLSEIKQYVVEQLYKSVLWTKTIEKLHGLGVTNIVECGPGKVLSGLNKRIVKGLNLYNLEIDTDFTATKDALGIIQK